MLLSLIDYQAELTIGCIGTITYFDYVGYIIKIKRRELENILDIIVVGRGDWVILPPREHYCGILGWFNKLTQVSKYSARWMPEKIL